MKMRWLLLAGALAVGAIAVSQAQVNVVPQTGTIQNYLGKTTFSAAFVGLVPPASATDTICIAGSATKTIKIVRFELSGTAGTLVTLPVTLLKRVTADTGGTAATTTANPANTIGKRDVNSGAATATLISYTAVPTINDTSPVYWRSSSLTLNVTGTTAAPAQVIDFYFHNSDLATQPTLRGAAEQACLNFNSVSVSLGVLNGSITWTEE